MLYIHNSINYHKLDCLFVECNFEILWIMTRPRVLPRPTSVLIVAVVYCPPWYNAGTNNELCEYILKSVDILNRKYPNAGFYSQAISTRLILDYLISMRVSNKLLLALPEAVMSHS
jgi:hypothetical protein